jgi:hypothetical protein
MFIAHFDNVPHGGPKYDTALYRFGKVARRVLSSDTLEQRDVAFEVRGGASPIVRGSGKVTPDLGQRGLP